MNIANGGMYDRLHKLQEDVVSRLVCSFHLHLYEVDIDTTAEALFSQATARYDTSREARDYTIAQMPDPKRVERYFRTFLANALVEYGLSLP